MDDELFLSEHFSFDELTVTSNKKLQEQNRVEAQMFLDPLRELASLLEEMRKETGPLYIHSGFRGAALNAATAGSSTKSQHMKGEAVDFTRPGDFTATHLDDLFATVLASLISSGLTFGQIIREEAERNYGISRWLHLSLGTPYRDPNLCGQVLTMTQGPDGKSVYNLIKVIPFGR